MAPSAADLLPLGELDREDGGRAGAKAATLAHLLRAGYRVPDGFVLTVDAFRRGIARGAPRLPDDVARALNELADELGDIALAVRSSGVREDGRDRSSAGQYATVLNVRGAQGLRDAVERCWASAFSRRVAAYLGTAPSEGVAPLAVLIQRLVPADAAGVAFTANPVTGEREEILVSAVRGLADRLVSGRASSDEWTVRGGRAIRRSGSEDAVDEAQVLAVAELARRVERTLGEPQDIEWAIAGGKLYLLQARPITALAGAPEAVPVPAEPPPGFWEREASHAPFPHTPMNRSLIFDVRNEAMRRCFEKIGSLPETLEFREIGGWEYLRLVPPGRKDRPAPPRWLFWLLARLSPYLRSRIGAARRFVRDDEAGKLLGRWSEEQRPAFARRIAEMQAVRLETLDDPELDAEIGAAVDLLHEGIRVHFLLHGAIAAPLAELAFACRDLLGWPEERAFELVNGLSTCSTEPSRKLGEIAASVSRRPAVRCLLDSVDKNTLRRLAEIDGELAASLEEYRRTYGCRALRYEVAEPTLAEEPRILLALLRERLARRDALAEVSARLEATRRHRLERARCALADRPEERRRFERVVDRAVLAYPVREDNEFYTISAPLALVRHRLLELGRRLAARDRIDEVEDVFFLEIEEAREVLSRTDELRGRIRRRRGERAWVEAHPGPASYGRSPGPPPPLDVLPAEARFVNETILWTVERIFEPDRSAVRQGGAGGVLRGLGASRGRYTGVVRVILGESEFDKLEAGDVLVCPITSPVWSVLFASVGAVVTDTGGVLSHSAIIAREYGVPAVVATGNATELLHDGQVVTVDGEAGVVTVEQAP